MGRYGNIDGIATLTNDPLAVQNIRKAKEVFTKRHIPSDESDKTNEHNKKTVQ